MKAHSPIFFTDKGKWISGSSLQFTNILSGISIIPSGSSTDFNAQQLAKILHPKTFILAGIVIDVRALHNLNIEFPIIVQPSAIVTSVNALHSSKTAVPIFFILAGTETFFRDLQF